MSVREREEVQKVPWGTGRRSVTRDVKQNPAQSGSTTGSVDEPTPALSEGERKIVPLNGKGDLYRRLALLNPTSLPPIDDQHNR